MDQNRLDQLRRELERFVGKHRRAHSPELEYHLTRLSSVISCCAFAEYRHMSAHQDGAELLAKIDALLAYTEATRELAERVREVLLRPPPDEEKPGFTE
jgi:hypothetical protein